MTNLRSVIKAYKEPIMGDNVPEGWTAEQIEALDPKENARRTGNFFERFGWRYDNDPEYRAMIEAMLREEAAQ